MNGMEDDVLENTPCQKTVLVVDDEPIVRATVKRALGEEFIIMEASNGEMAVDMARRKKPDVVLMDVRMPQMDGYTACCRIKEDPYTSFIPVIMLTALDFVESLEKSVDLGADGYIVKPFRKQELRARVRAILRRSKPVA